MKHWNWIWNEDWKIAYIYMYKGSNCWMFSFMLLQNTDSYITDSRFKRFILFIIMTWFLLIYFKLWKTVLKIYADHTSPPRPASNNCKLKVPQLMMNHGFTWNKRPLAWIRVYIKVNCRNNVLFGEYLQFCLKPKTCQIRIAA